MINRRFMIVPPALPSGGHAEQLEQTSKDRPCLMLETANMRALQSWFSFEMRLLSGGLVGASP
jgi:hypothetical protein